MPQHNADATWTGTVIPEELLAAAHASCFAMTTAYVFDQAGYSPEQVDAEATVDLDRSEDGFTIDSVTLTADGSVPDATDEQFATVVERAEQHRPVSTALAGTEVVVQASPD
ncbi:hypothetical protein BRC81_11970 [Halobacteriales archaeon QS_1_68_20]|nr:MAG: hypothetical protein BRC81_11970 [Halobacteriales archaeon QS_1_68_20]